MKLRSPVLRGGRGQKVHISDDNGLTTRCRKPVGRAWTVTTEEAEVTCSTCAGELSGWQFIDKIQRRRF